MTEEEKKYCKLLHQSCELQTDDHFSNYITAIENLKKSKNPDVLRSMLSSFRDVDAGEIQYELVEACETFSDEIYVDIFVDEGINFHNVSPKWFGLMFQSLLNTDSCVDLFIDKVRKADSIKSEFYNMYIGNLSDENIKYKKIIEDLKGII